MKMITQKETDLLLQMVSTYPSQRFFHLGSSGLSLCHMLDAFCKERAFEYDLNCDNEAFLEDVTAEGINAEYFHYKKQRYNKMGKEYEMVFLTIDIDTLENEALFFKKIYHIMKNNSKLVLFFDKEKKGLSELEQRLLSYNYVAINPIDIFENYMLLTAQRMHGWGDFEDR